HIPIHVRGFDRQVVPARPIGGNLFDAVTGAARIDGLDDLPPAVAAAENDAQSSPAAGRLLSSLPVDAKATRVARERFGLLVAATRPGPDRLPGDDRPGGFRPLGLA